MYTAFTVVSPAVFIFLIIFYIYKKGKFTKAKFHTLITGIILYFIFNSLIFFQPLLQGFSVISFFSILVTIYRIIDTTKRVDVYSTLYSCFASSLLVLYLNTSFIHLDKIFGTLGKLYEVSLAIALTAVIIVVLNKINSLVNSNK